MHILGFLALLALLCAGAAAVAERRKYKTRTFYKKGVRAVIEECSEETRSAYVAAGWREYL